MAEGEGARGRRVAAAGQIGVCACAVVAVVAVVLAVRDAKGCDGDAGKRLERGRCGAAVRWS